MPERVLVWGAGGHGKVVADLIRLTGHHLVGFADRDEGKL
ncbi:MAG: acetyltransferase, partial [Gemmatimonadaceae bacterium]|nr:acetyltransferase [Gemmatimonadaceae bacterium]